MRRATNQGDTASAYRLTVRAHVTLRSERKTRTEVATALGTLSTMAPALVHGPALTVGERARRLGVHPATLRTWEEHGILHPERERATGYREFGPECLRAAEHAMHLRPRGHRL